MIGLVAAVGYAAEVSQCVYLCGLTFRAGDRGATNDLLVQSLRRQCGAREAHAAVREDFVEAAPGFPVFVIEGTTQLIRAASLNNLPRVLQLIQLGAPLDFAGEHGGCSSALHCACELGHERIARALLDGKYEGRGAATDLRKTAISSTPIMCVSRWGHEGIVRLLLSHGASLELQDSLGYTALHWAVLFNHASIVALLCDAPGATAALALKARASFGSVTPLSLAILRNRTECEAVLRAHGAPE